MQPPQCQPDGGGHHWNGAGGGALRAERPADVLPGLGAVADQPHDVVGDGRHRQPLHRGLQLELQTLAPVHGAQQRLAALLLLDFDPRAQQVADARHPLRQGVLPPGGPGAGTARGRQPPLQEFAHGLQARQARLGNVGNAPVHQLEVRHAGGKTRMGGGVLAFHGAGQFGQAVQQLRLVVARGLANGAGQPSQFALGMGQHGRCLPRRRQTEQRSHAVGIDFQQLLHQPAQPARCHGACQQHHARKAVGMQRKVGVDLTVPVGDGGGDQSVLVQDMPHQRRAAEFMGGQHPQVQAGQALAGQARQPLLRHQLQRGRRVAVAKALHIDRPQKTPAHKLGMQFPADAKRPEVHAQMGGGGVGLRQVVVAQQGANMCPAGIALRPVAHHHHMRDGQGSRHGFRRTGVNFVVQHGALRMAGNDWHASPQDPNCDSPKKAKRRHKGAVLQQPGRLLFDESLFPLVLDRRQQHDDQQQRSRRQQTG